MNKYLIKFLLIFFSVIDFSYADAPPCEIDVSTSHITPPQPASSCRTDADALQINLYEVGLCGDSNNFSPNVYDTDVIKNQINTSNCTKIWNGGSSGVNQIINSLAASGVNGGNALVPASGTYLYGYIKLTNALGVQVNKQFSVSSSGDTSGSGTYCWTKNTQYTKDKLNGINEINDALTAICSSSPPSNADLGFVTTKNLSLDCSYNGIPEESIFPGIGAYPDYCDTTRNGAHKLYVYETPQLVPSGGTIQQGGSASKGNFAPTEFLGFFTLTNPLVVPADPSNIRLSVLFAMTGNAAVDNKAPIGSPTPILGFHSQAFDIMIQSY